MPLPTNTKPDSFIQVALFSALIASGMALYLFWQNQKLSYQLELSRQVTASPSPSPTPNPSGIESSQPSLINLKENSLITSPINIKGIVPSGWMFEGQFPIEIRDNNNKIIGTGVGKDLPPGSWSSGNPVEFTANISYSTSAQEGFIILLSDNPSGIPEKQLTFKLPVKFK